VHVAATNACSCRGEGGVCVFGFDVAGLRYGVRAGRRRGITGLERFSVTCGGCQDELDTGAESAYALDYDLPRDSLKPAVQVEYDRQLETRRSQGPVTAPDATFPALGVQVREGAVQSYGAPLGTEALGQLAGAEARLTDGSQAWSPGRAVFMPVGFTGLATKTKATAFVIFADGTYHEATLNGNAAVRGAQAEAVKFNLLAGAPAPPAQQQ
jgi:hypothetical protein